MAMASFLDPLASRLLALRTVSPSQWVLRGAGAAASATALLIAAPGPLDAHLGSMLAALTVACAVLVQVWRPDSDVGLLSPLAVVLLLTGHADAGFLTAAGTGLALLLAHMAFAVAATAPAHGALSGSGWALIGRGALVVLAATLVAGAVVAALMGVALGAWMVVPGILAVIALFAVVLPRAT